MKKILVCLSVILLMFVGCSTPAPDASVPDSAPETDDSDTAPDTSEVSIFLVDLEGKGGKGTEIGCGDRLVSITEPAELSDTSPRSKILASLNLLFTLTQADLDQLGLHSSLTQSDLKAVDASIDNGVATVKLEGTVSLGGVCDDPRFTAQVEETIKYAVGVSTVKVLLNGSEDEYKKIGNQKGE